jgi:hypothetical protein
MLAEIAARLAGAHAFRCRIVLLAHKKTRPPRIKRTGFPRHALAEFITRPQAVAQIGAKPGL